MWKRFSIVQASLIGVVFLMSISISAQNDEYAEMQYAESLVNYRTNLSDIEGQIVKVRKDIVKKGDLYASYKNYSEKTKAQKILIESTISLFDKIPVHTSNNTDGKIVLIEEGHLQKLIDGNNDLLALIKQQNYLKDNASVESLLTKYYSFDYGKYMLSTDILQLVVMQIQNASVESIYAHYLLALNQTK